MRANTAMWVILTTLLVGAFLPAFDIVQGFDSTTYPDTLPTIQDFLINNTATGNTTQFAFYVSDSVALQNCTFWNDNGTGGAGSNSSLQLSGTGPVYANFTVNAFTQTTLLNFTFWLWNTNSSISPATIGYRTLAIYNRTMPYTSLGKAITAVEGANNWTTSNDALGTAGVDPYQGLILKQNTTAQYESVIDDYALGPAITPMNESAISYTLDSSSGSYNWTTPSAAYDKNITTAASVSFAGVSGYSHYLILNFSQIMKGQYIAYYVHHSGGTTAYMSIDIYTTAGSWVNVRPMTAPTWDAWTNTSAFGLSSYTAVRFQFEEISVATLAVCSLNETSVTMSYAPPDYLDVLQYCAYSEKMNLTWSKKDTDILYALGNITMIGSLPTTDSSYGSWHNGTGYYANVTAYPYDFSVDDTWALYGYYYANNSWASSYQSKWNITAAYNQFNAAVYYSVNTGHGYPSPAKGMPYWIFNDSTGVTMLDRYYDEQAETIDAYLIFYSLLNQSTALTQAANWWKNFTNQNDWSNNYGGYYKYNPTDTEPSFECEAGFFLKIISILKYYLPSLNNYSRVLTDIENRFLSNKWNSYQWLAQILVGSNLINTTEYVVVHEFVGNSETRLENTLGAWQALLGAYLQMNTTYQNNIVDMLSGNTTSNIQPAWSLLLNASFYNSSTKQFASGSSSPNFNAGSTALGEVTLFQMGIVPSTSTVAFPLEELGYEYTDDIDPVLLVFNLNSTARQVTVPVVQAGTITFQYGESPITYNFTSSGVYLISFTSSWNMISNVTYESALPSNLIYFYLPARAIVPEFPVLLVLPLFMTATLLAPSIYRRKRLVYRKIHTRDTSNGTSTNSLLFFAIYLI